MPQSHIIEITEQLNICARLRENNNAGRLACVETYGCQQNEADSEQLRGYLDAMGFSFTSDRNCADIVILNTCAIRDHAEKRVFGKIGSLTKQTNPHQIVCVCGCMAQREAVAQRIKRSFPRVDLVFGTHMLWKFPSLLLRVLEQKERVFEAPDSDGIIAEGIPVVRQNKLCAWVSIMYGCNNFCTYCVVPYVRGRERSRKSADIINEVRALIADGFREITLLGQNVNSYGKDIDDLDFSGLLQALNALDGDFLIRFMTSHPKDAGERLFDTMAACQKVAPQLHLPVQSGSSRVLSAMNRGYTREHYLDLISSLRSRMPDIVLTSDIIIGFPGETQAEFEETLSLLET
ncbi:MAG: tRNA (N6-isopentenyl adenosine(37)-C2)-methylthiotransferase MiaB, partial [Evtepia sp.]